MMMTPMQSTINTPAMILTVSSVISFSAGFPNGCQDAIFFFKTSTSSCTAAALLSNCAFSSAVS